MNRQFKELDQFVLSDGFYSKIKEHFNLMKDDDIHLAIGTIDIDHFNYINDLLGYEVGDLILQKMAVYFSKILKGNGIFTRLHADIFAICLYTSNEENVASIYNQLTNCSAIVKDILPSSYGLTTSAGVMVLHEKLKQPISAIIDKANYARQKAKHTMGNTFCFYDKKLNEELQWQKSVTLSMESALEDHEYEMYLQPKVAIKNDFIAGAEALVRWNHPKYGLIPPMRFIPIMEQSGFIQKLDFFMLEEACKFLKLCKQEHIPQIPISVNFSKAHLINPSLVDQIFQTVNRLGVQTRMIEIEFTESIFTEGFERLFEIVSDLKLLGFHVSLDDFGSAYSSLNCLKELPIDIIKIDRGFLQDSANTEKGKLIITKIVEMIKSLRMVSIMEGVETLDQVEFLRKLSCDFIQGYFYAKPMPKESFIEYLKQNTIVSNLADYTNNLLKQSNDSYIDKIPQEFQMDNWELYTLGKNIDMGLMKGYLDGEVRVQYINDRALEYLGYTRQEFRELCNNSIVSFTHPDDIHIVQENTEKLLQSGEPLQFQTRAIRKDGKTIILQGRSSCVNDEHGRPIGIYAFQDVTDELERVESLQKSLTDKIDELENIIQSERKVRESLHLSEERYRVIAEQSADIMFDWDFISDTVVFSGKHTSILGNTAMIKHPMENPILSKLIHPSDLSIFRNWLQKIYSEGGNQQIEFRSINKKKEYIWVRCNSSILYDLDKKPIRSVGVFSNINAQKREFDILKFKSQRDPLTKTLHKEELSHQIQSHLELSINTLGAFLMIDIDNFKALNDNLGHQLGDSVLLEFSTQLIAALPDNSFIGRMGGDEFGAFIPGINEKEACKYARKILDTLHKESFGEYHVRVSIGISLYPKDAITFEELYFHADIALYESKHSGKDCYTLFKEGMRSCTLVQNRTPIE